MDVLPDDFHKVALELIHHSQKDQSELSSSVRSILKEQFFKGEKVLVDGKEFGTIVDVCRQDSPSNKENPAKYRVETQKSYLNSVPISRLARANSTKEFDTFSYITEVARKSNSAGPWVVCQEHLDKHKIKDKVHPFFAMKRSASSSSSGALTKKPALEMNGAGPSHKHESSSSDDDEPVVVGVRKSAVGMAPSSATAKKMTKKLTVRPPKPPKEPKQKKSPTKKSKKTDQSPSKKTKPKKSEQNGKQKSPSKSKKEDKKEGKKSKKNMNLSEYLTNAKDGNNDSPQLTYEEKMANRAKNINKQAIKAIVNIDVPSLTILMEKAAKSFPTKFVDDIPNEFVRYLFNKAVLKKEQKGKDATERAKIRSENKDMLAVNEFSYMHRKLNGGKFEDTWVDGSSLPELQTIDCNQSLLFKCIRLVAFLQSYRQALSIKKTPGLFDFMDSLTDGVDGFWKVTGPILVQVTDFIRRHQRTIPHFNNTGFLNYKVKSITTRSVHQIARKILNPDYNPDAVEEEEESDAASVTSSHADSDKLENNSDHSTTEHTGENGNSKANGVKKDEAESDNEETIEDEEDQEALIDQQTKEDDELCERFSNFELYELSPLDQARVLELLMERVEASGPVRDSMKNVDAEVKKLKESLVTKKKKIDKLNKDLEEVPPLISEEEYAMYTRAQTIGIVKQNRKRKELEDKIVDIEGEIAEIQEAIEEMRGCSRFRASPLGFDRYFRRYWFLPPTPGLLVEQGAWTTSQTPNEEESLALPVKSKFNNYDLSTEQLVLFLRTLINGGYPSDRAPVKWFHLNSVEKLDKLVDALNPKGVRESQLKEAIQKSRAVIDASLKQK